MHCVLFILLLLAFLKKVFFSSCNFFLKLFKKYFSDKALLKCACFILTLFGCLLSSFTSPDYFTHQKWWYVCSFSPFDKLSEASFENTVSRKPDNSGKEGGIEKKRWKTTSHWLPHLSVRHKPWHWSSQATHLPEERRVKRGHLQQGDCHCLSVALTYCDNRRRRSNKSDIGGRWLLVGLLRELQDGKGFALILRAVWTLMRAWGDPPWNAGFKG